VAELVQPPRLTNADLREVASTGGGDVKLNYSNLSPDLIAPPAPALPLKPLQLLQEWEGTVTEVKDESFVCDLVDITAGHSIPEEIAELPIDEISEDDRDLLRPGALFRWTIGYYEAGGVRRKTSQVQFRRLPMWRPQDLKKSEEWADKMAKFLAATGS
jgi:hypothetical protein